MSYALEFTEDPRELMRRAGGLLEAEPVLGTVVATVTSSAVDALERGEPAPDHPQWWLTVVDKSSGEPVGVVMRTAPFKPYPLYVLPIPDAAATQVAAALVEWLDKVPQAAPADALVVWFEVLSEQSRRLVARAYGARSAKLLEQWRATSAWA